jgi:ribosomal protein S27E
MAIAIAMEASTLNHVRFFVLDRDHNTASATCQPNSNFRDYTCYGCHEYTLARRRAGSEIRCAGSAIAGAGPR